MTHPPRPVMPAQAGTHTLQPTPIRRAAVMPAQAGTHDGHDAVVAGVGPRLREDDGGGRRGGRRQARSSTARQAAGALSPCSAASCAGVPTFSQRPGHVSSEMRPAATPSISSRPSAARRPLGSPAQTLGRISARLA